MQKILIVDDNDDNLYFLQSLLSASGYEVVLAHNGADFLAHNRANFLAHRRANLIQVLLGHGAGCLSPVSHTCHCPSAL